MIFRGSGPVLLRNPLCCDFSGGGDGPTSGSAHDPEQSNDSNSPLIIMVCQRSYKFHNIGTSCVYFEIASGAIYMNFVIYTNIFVDKSENEFSVSLFQKDYLIHSPHD